MKVQRTFFILFLASLLFLCVFTPLLTTSSIIKDEAVVHPSEHRFFKPFLKRVDYTLEKRSNGVDWLPYTGLQVVFTNVSENVKKFTLIFDSTSTYADYRINISFRKCVDYSVNRTSKVLTLTFNEFVVLFNYSDIAGIPGLVFTHGKSQGKAWFMVQKNNIRNQHVVLDPTYKIDDAYWIDALDFTNGNKLVRMSNGTLYCAYSNYKDMGADGLQMGIWLYYSTDLGVTWFGACVIYQVDFEYYYPALVVNSSDVLQLTYDSWDLAADDHSLMFTENRYGYWENAVFLAYYTAGQAQFSSMAVDSLDNVHVAYEDMDWVTARYQVCYRERYVSNMTWGKITNISNYLPYGTKTAYRPVLMVDDYDTVDVFFWGSYVYTGIPRTTTRGIFLVKKVLDVWNNALAVRSTTLTTTVYYTTLDCCKNSTNTYNVVYAYKTNTIPVMFYIACSYSNNNGTSWTHYGLDSYASSVQRLKNPTISADSMDVVHFAYERWTTVTSRFLIYYKNNSLLPYECLNIDSATYKYSPNMLWANYPIVCGVHTNVPKKEFCLVYVNETVLGANWSVNYYERTGVSWGSCGVVPVFYYFLLYSHNGFINIFLGIMVCMCCGAIFLIIFFRRRRRSRKKYER